MKGGSLMSLTTRSVPLIGAVAGLALAGCGGSSSPKVTPSAKLENVSGSSVGQIVLSPVGAQRIGLQTARVSGGGRAQPVAIPYSAIVYDQSGQSYAFKQLAPLRYVEVAVKVDHIAGNTAYLKSGPQPGTPVVTVGAEELYGVQTGVLAQT